MEPLSTVVMVGVLFVLPQVIGFGASRLGSRRSARVWALAAAGTIGALWAIFLSSERGAPCGTGRAAVNFCTPFVLGLHVVVGGLLGTLDRRARRVFAADEGAQSQRTGRSPG